MWSRILLAAALVMAPLGVGPPTSWCGGRRATTPRRTRRSGRSSRPSSRRPASRSSSSSISKRSFRRRSWRRSRPASRPTSPSASGLSNTAEQWAYEDRLVDLSDAIGHFSDLFDPMRSTASLLNGTTGQRALYALPMGNSVNHLHVWKSLLEQRRLHPCGHSSASGRRSGRSGAIRCSRRCARPSAATTSGASACPCQSTQAIRIMGSTSSWMPRRRTT